MSRRCRCEVNVELFQTVGFILFLSWKSELSKWKTMCWHRVGGSSKVHSHYQYEYNTIRAFKNTRRPTAFIHGSIQWLDENETKRNRCISFNPLRSLVHLHVRVQVKTYICSRTNVIHTANISWGLSYGGSEWYLFMKVHREGWIIRIASKY